MRIYLINFGVGAIALGVGFRIGYDYAKKNLWQHYGDMADAEIAEGKRHYEEKYKKLVATLFEEVAESENTGTAKVFKQEVKVAPAAAEAMTNYQGHFNRDENSQAYGETVMALAQTVQVLDEGNDGLPTIISLEEFEASDHDHMQSSLVYYAGDNILLDERDEVVEDADILVGNHNLIKLSEGGDSPIHVRNFRFEMDFEIVFNPGEYGEIHE